MTGAFLAAAEGKVRMNEMGDERDDLKERVRSLGILVAMMAKELDEVRELLRTRRVADSKAEEAKKVRDAEVGDLKAALQFYKETLAAEGARDKVRCDGGIDKSTQSGGVEVAAKGTQTARRTYASVAVQTEKAGITWCMEDKMDVDGPSGASLGEGHKPDDPATKKPTGTTPVGDRPV